ncbi:MAG: DegT/DnrJ/EryC1/StrS family aminotransferase, partial [Salinivirgaceae bacterium]|nr:DegT/DnrJ/EryC1/StrS family aminotransferase [Salinivirgaceae bacterium]
NFGDLSILSFHATKVFNTFEGGAIICKDEKTKKRIDNLKNFGYVDGNVIAPGINGKMNEVQASMGLLQLKYIDGIILNRKKIADKYRDGLRNITGLSFIDDIKGVKHNYSYFPILINAEEYGITRDELFEKLAKSNIIGRRYFYPLISQFSTYRGLESAQPGRMPVAERITEEVLCLPIYPDLEDEIVEIIINLLKTK